VVFYADGNSGLDGPWGNRNRCVVQFLDHSICIKAGVAHLAGALPAPLLSVVATEDFDGRRRVVSSEPLVLQDRVFGAQRDEFVRNAMQSFYGKLEYFILQRPQLWESACLLHRWRFPNRN